MRGSRRDHAGGQAQGDDPGAGPNRIGQGIEFDYCCVHASYALAARGFETIMVNCNPETVSTDYDTSDRLYFEPLTYEDVMDVIDVERPDGVVVTLGGQTPLKLARMLEESGVNIMGTKPDAIDFAEDRERFAALLDKLGIMYLPAGQATSFEEAEAVAAHIGYPLLVRPSYVLGGRGMMIAYDAEHLRDYMTEAARISPDYPVYLDRFLEVRSSPMSTPCATARRSTSAVSWSISRRPVFTPATPRRAFRRLALARACRRSSARLRAASRWRWESAAWSTCSTPLRARPST